MVPVEAGRIMRDLISSCSHPGMVDQGTPLKALNFSRFHRSAFVGYRLKSRALMTPSGAHYQFSSLLSDPYENSFDPSHFGFCLPYAVQL